MKDYSDQAWIKPAQANEPARPRDYILAAVLVLLLSIQF